MKTLNVTCACCDSINNVSKQQLFDKPMCQNCGKSIVLYRPVTVNEANFDNHVLHTDLPVIVDFWASWCGACIQFSPIFAQAAAGWEPRVRFVKVDADATPLLSRKYGLRSIPTVLLFYQGEIVEERRGSIPPNFFDRWLEEQVTKIGA